MFSCVRENLTNRQVFLLVGAGIAAIFKTKNVALDGAYKPTEGVDDTPTTTTIEESGSSEVVGSLVEAAVHSLCNDSSEK